MFDDCFPKKKGQRIIKKYFYFISVIFFQWYIQVVSETGTSVWVPKLKRPKNTFKMFFFNCISTKYAINDFTVHLIILKWQKGKNAEGKNNKTRRGRSERRNCLRKLNMSRECSLFLLSKLFTLLVSSSQIASLFPIVYSHTKF